MADAASLVKEITTTKFDASVDLAVRLGVDPRKADQMVRGVVTLPHGTGKTVSVLALVTPAQLVKLPSLQSRQLHPSAAPSRRYSGTRRPCPASSPAPSIRTPTSG